MVSAGVHPPDPFHLVVGFQRFRNALCICRLFYRPKKQFFCLPVNICKIGVQFTAGQQIAYRTRNSALQNRPVRASSKKNNTNTAKAVFVLLVETKRIARRTAVRRHARGLSDRPPDARNSALQNRPVRASSKKNNTNTAKAAFVLLVETKRIELSTLRMRTVRSPS